MKKFIIGLLACVTATTFAQTVFAPPGSGGSSTPQVNSDWAATSGVALILSKPSFSLVASSGNYVDLSNKPALSTVAGSGLYSDLLSRPSLATVATSGSYADLTSKPTIPAAQINSDWSASSGLSQVLNKPTTLAGYGITDATSASALSTALASYATTSSLSAYATTSSLSAYALTSSLSAYATTSSLSAYATTASLGSYVTSTSLTSSLSGYVTSSSLTSTLSPYALTSSLSGYETISALNTTLASYTTSSTLATTLSGYATTSALTTGLSGKFATPTGTTAQYIRGDGSLGTSPLTFNFGIPNTRSLAVSTSYQATDPTKAAVFTISPSCAATISLTTGATCTMQARVNTATATCSNGTVVATWTNGNTGSLTVGLNLTQTVGSPGNLNVPIGGSVILCPTSGTFTVTTAIDQSAG